MQHFSTIIRRIRSRQGRLALLLHVRKHSHQPVHEHSGHALVKHLLHNKHPYWATRSKIRKKRVPSQSKEALCSHEKHQARMTAEE